jgi:hypothetical protein
VFSVIDAPANEWLDYHNFLGTEARPSGLSLIRFSGEAGSALGQAGRKTGWTFPVIARPERGAPLALSLLYALSGPIR